MKNIQWFVRTETTGLKLSNSQSPEAETLRGRKYDFAGDDDAAMYVYDILGREIEIIQLSNVNTMVSFSVINMPNGIYTYKINIGNETKTGKIQILK
jgi:hypothetical protein